MYQERYTYVPKYIDSDSIKIYGISVENEPVDETAFVERIQYVKQSRAIDWPNTPAFVIFHNGATQLYLVLCWWGNDNELFTSVSVLVDGVWQEDPTQYSFCLYDMQLMWAERNIYIETMDCESPSLMTYQQRLAV